MAAEIAGVFEEGLREKVEKAKVLIVGAGGIGCELLKNIVLSGFKDIEIIDLDTIDVSNLNRQFLFHKKHVGKSKAEVARESALGFNPNVNIKAYHDSITSLDYGVNFYKKFALVMNALDNRAARNHVNRMCLAADVPLIESGTAGYDGQVELIKKGLTQCYECHPKAAQKTYPGCTIRNTPSEPIHCIVWAKHLFNQLFGEDDPDEDVSPDTADPEAAGDAGSEALKTNANEKGNVERVATRAWAQTFNYAPEKLFQKLFHDDIKYLLSMDNLWKKRRPPTPLTWDKLPDAVAGSSKNDKEGGLKDQKYWSIAECGRIFEESVRNLTHKLKSLKEGDHLVWDKDDKSAMDFVASCANLRAYIFGISQKTRFDIKSMAGNIIPAIATTNAIIAGLVVLHAFHILEGKLECCQSVYLRTKLNHRKQLIVPEKVLNPPNKKCYVCASKPMVLEIATLLPSSSQSEQPSPGGTMQQKKVSVEHKTEPWSLQVNLCVDVASMTVKELEEQVLKKALNMVAPDVIHKGTIVISSEEGETETNNSKTLSEFGIADGSILKVDDFLVNYELNIVVNQRSIPKDGPNFEVVADMSELRPASAEAANGTSDQDDDLELVDDTKSDNEAAGSKKRKSEAVPDSKAKKQKVSNEEKEDDEIMIL